MYKDEDKQLVCSVRGGRALKGEEEEEKKRDEEEEEEAATCGNCQTMPEQIDQSRWVRKREKEKEQVK